MCLTRLMLIHYDFFGQILSLDINGKKCTYSFSSMMCSNVSPFEMVESVSVADELCEEPCATMPTNNATSSMFIIYHHLDFLVDLLFILGEATAKKNADI